MALPFDFNVTYQTYYPKVRKLCLGYTGDPDQAQDLVQETFIKVWQNADKFRGESQLSTWIYRIAANTCLYHLRTAKNRPTTRLEEHHQNRPAEASEKEAQLAVLYQCISQLAPADRLIVTLVLDEVPYSEIAGIVGISEGNLRVKIHRAKQQLAELYQRHGQL